VTTTIDDTTLDVDPSTAPSPGRPLNPDRRWAVAGVVAGVAGIVSVVASSFSGAVYQEDVAGDAAAITERLGEMTAPILVFHAATTVSALLLVVVAAGLRRDLLSRLPSGSLLPSVAAQGL
jgi:hypothetical protein